MYYTNVSVKSIIIFNLKTKFMLKIVITPNLSFKSRVRLVPGLCREAEADQGKNRQPAEAKTGMRAKNRHTEAITGMPSKNKPCEARMGPVNTRKDFSILSFLIGDIISLYMPWQNRKSPNPV